MRIVKFLGVILISLLVLTSNGVCKREKPTVTSNRIKKFVPIKYNITLNINAGFITGKYGDRLKGFDGNMNDQMFGGFGGCFEYHLRDSYFFSFDIERGIKEYNDVSFKATMYGLSTSLKFKNHTSSYPYIGAGVGVVSGDIDYSSRDLGSSKYFMIKLGFANQTSSKFNTKVELYFRTILVSDEIEILVASSSSITAIGARFIFGLGF